MWALQSFYRGIPSFLTRRYKYSPVFQSHFKSTPLHLWSLQWNCSFPNVLGRHSKICLFFTVMWNVLFIFLFSLLCGISFYYYNSVPPAVFWVLFSIISKENVLCMVFYTLFKFKAKQKVSFSVFLFG